MTQHQVHRGTRLPRSLDSKIAKITKRQGSTISQFLRTAAIEKCNREMGVTK